MSHAASVTATATSTMTEARVRAVMLKVGANFTAFAIAGLVARERATKWVDDLTYLQLKEALAFFEVQCTTPGGGRIGLRYVVSADGTLREDSKSGGVDVYGIPAGSSVNLYAHLRSDAPDSVREELKRRGWGFDGSALDGAHSEERSFSSDGYGLTRSKVGTWP